jgi:hypothetical protein
VGYSNSKSRNEKKVKFFIIYNKVISESSDYVKQNLTWKAMETLLYYHRNCNLQPFPISLVEAVEFLAFNEHQFRDYFLGRRSCIVFADKVF